MKRRNRIRLLPGIWVLFIIIAFPKQAGIWANAGTELWIIPAVENSIRIVNGTFLGNASRNFYGDSLPSSLNVLMVVDLGKGETVVTREKGTEEWAGAGWTGQPLIVEENGEAFLIIGAYDHHLKKIRLSDGAMVWQYAFDDIIKGTGSIWFNREDRRTGNAYMILQGSRLGTEHSLSSPLVPSFRAISMSSGKALWKFNSRKTASYSRDVDGSALVLGDTVFIGLENGTFVVFHPGPTHVNFKQGMLQPGICREYPLYNRQDELRHGGNLVTESSPCRLGDRIYITSGSGHVFGYNLKKKIIDWDFFTGSDMDGSPVVTDDSCLLVTLEKQYIQGPGGVLKLDPSRPPDSSVVWFFPTGSVSFNDWEGGIIGSACVNALSRGDNNPPLAAFTGIDGYLYVVRHDRVTKGKTVTGPDGRKKYPCPQLVFKYRTGPSISTPIIIGNRLLAAGYKGIYLFGFDHHLRFSLLSHFPAGCEATPFAYKGVVYVASRNGKLYALGENEKPVATE